MTVEAGSGNAAELFVDAPFDAATLASMIEAFAAAWHELEIMGVDGQSRSDELRWKLVARILKAVGAGERDPERLKLLALHAIDGRRSKTRFR